MLLAQSIISILQKVRSELTEKYAVSSIGLFGSVARNEYAVAESDVDIIVDFSKPIGIEFIDLAEYLESIIHRKVDLVSKKGIKEKYFRQIERDIIYV